MSMNKTIAEFESRLSKLRDWPDGAVIYELTSFALRNEHMANHIADIVVSRIIDPKTNPAFKVPLFYLMDSIMKAAGALYAPLFASHIVVVFQRTFAELIDIDKARLDYMLSTWEERGMLPLNLLMDMRNSIGTRIVAEQPPPSAGQLGVPPRRETPRNSRPPPQFDHRGPPLGGQQPPLDRRGGGSTPFNQLSPDLRRAMQEELDRFYSSMQATDRLPLSELGHINPQLFLQIQNQASSRLGQVRSGGPQGEGTMALTGGRNIISAFICEQSIPLDMDAVNELVPRLQEWNPVAVSGDSYLRSLRKASLRMAKRLDLLLPSVMRMPPMPTVVSDKPPDSLLKKREAEILKTEPKIKLPVPAFRSDMLGRPPKDALKALYDDRPFYCRQDGMRFKSQADLAMHLDALFVKNQDKQRQEGKRMTHRQWYCREMQWISDFGSLKVSEDNGERGGLGSVEGGAEGGSWAAGDVEDTSADVEMIVPADEHFTRCPVSHEAFIPEWDLEEGDYLYRNAVKVLVTKQADPDLYEDCHKTSHSAVKYAIVHQKLVMEGWIAAGTAASLRDTLEKVNSKYKGGNAATATLAKAIGDALETAAEDEDPEDIFVRLNENGDVGEEFLMSGVDGGAGGSMEEEGIPENKSNE